MSWNDAGFVELRRWQQGAFSRDQAAGCGVSDRMLAVRCRSGRIQRLHRGVYVDFSGPVPWDARMWAAWLAYGPDAALAGESALRRYGLEGDWPDGVIRLEVPHERRVRAQPGIVVTRSRDFAGRVDSREPSTVRLEVAILSVAARCRRPIDGVALILDACRQRRTTPERLREELESLRRLPRRAALQQVLRDATSGAESFLELTYLRRVERSHHLPVARRQVRAIGVRGVLYRDSLYDDYGLIIELDGHAGHDDAGSRWRDMDRDNAALLEEMVTLRFGYQLVDDPCGAAIQVATVLRARGWPGQPIACGSGCPVGVLGSSAYAN